MRDFDQLPPDAMVSILVRLDYKTILRTKSLSKTWFGFVSHNQAFWRERFERDFAELECGDVDFEEEYKIEYGWRFVETRGVIMQGNGNGILDVHVKGSKMVFGSWNNTVKVWDLGRMVCVQEFEESNSVWSVAFDGKNIFVGLNDGYIHEWSMVSGGLCRAWQAHAHKVLALSLSTNNVVSGDKYCLKVWDASSFKCLKEVDAHGEKQLCVVGEQIICGLEYEKRVLVFHQEHGLLFTFDVCGKVRSVSANSNHICVGCVGGEIELWDKKTREKVAVLDGDGCMVVGVLLDTRRLISTTVFGRVKVWDAKSFTSVETIDPGIGCVLRMGTICCMAHDKGKVVIASDNGSICVLDFAG